MTSRIPLSMASELLGSPFTLSLLTLSFCLPHFTNVLLYSILFNSRQWGPHLLLLLLSKTKTIRELHTRVSNAFFPSFAVPWLLNGLPAFKAVSHAFITNFFENLKPKFQKLKKNRLKVNLIIYFYTICFHDATSVIFALFFFLL